jgi:hypothetical protein
LVQDEFYNIDLIVEFMNQIGITHVYTCSEPRDWNALYGGLRSKDVKIKTALTGYVDESRLSTIPRRPMSERPIDIGYRAWANPYWLGEHGQQKVKVGQVVGRRARERGFVVDINNPAATDFLIGSEWFEFLLNCKAVVGVECGASVLDRNGEINKRVDAYLAMYPAATFEDCRAACFAEQDNKLGLSCISPRHFEACMTRTCQLLLEGDYNGVLEPWRHYIPIRRDYSNVDEVLNALSDKALVERIVEQAYADIVESGRWSYRKFIGEIEDEIIERASNDYRLGFKGGLAYALLRWREWTTWQIAYAEAGKKWRKLFPLAMKIRQLVGTVSCRIEKLRSRLRASSP